MTLDDLLVDRPSEGVFKVHRDAFRDPEVFELEMRQIFERQWVFLGLEDQLPQPHDYLTTWLAHQPVVLSRDAEGRLHGFFNTCRHRGATIFNRAQGNSRFHVCSYHGWSYDSAGRSVGIKGKEAGAYSPAFDIHEHGLVRLPRLAIYRGLIFASLDPDVIALEDYLGEARTFLDLIVDQSPEGVELVPGAATYTFEGNWKLQIENSVDVYHFTSTHPSFLAVLEKRRSSGGEKERVSSYGGMQSQSLERGSVNFAHGHHAMWGPSPSPEAKPLYASIEEIRARVGEERSKWMLYTRNLTIFPNLQFGENAALQLRVIRPLSATRTEMTTYCVAPKGESDAARFNRLRQYEDFFNPTGMATPDDTINYENIQIGYRAGSVGWQQGHERGLGDAALTAPDALRGLGVRGTRCIVGGYSLGDEGVFRDFYREWMRLLKASPSARRHADASGAP